MLQSAWKRSPSARGHQERESLSERKKKERQRQEKESGNAIMSVGGKECMHRMSGGQDKQWKSRDAGRELLAIMEKIYSSVCEDSPASLCVTSYTDMHLSGICAPFATRQWTCRASAGEDLRIRLS